MSNPNLILTVKLNGTEVWKISRTELPIEKTSALELRPSSSIEFVDSNGLKVVHKLGNHSGWLHLSVRVHPSLALQADCVISKSKKFEPEDFKNGQNIGIRFQPSFIAEKSSMNEQFIGKGLFARGLAFSGTVTPGNLLLSCLCDKCLESFLVQTYHSGFSEMGYFYSESGKDTLLISSRIPGVPSALASVEASALNELESRLPLASDKSHFKYLNSFRCPDCNAPYIDFQQFPDLRASEYYAICFVGHKPTVIEDAARLIR